MSSRAGRRAASAGHAGGVLEEHRVAAVVAVEDPHLTNLSSQLDTRLEHSLSRSPLSHITATTAVPTLAAARPSASRAALPDEILSYSQRITPSDHFVNWQQDPQSNYIARVPPGPGVELRVEVDLVADMAVLNPFDFFLEPECRA